MVVGHALGVDLRGGAGRGGAGRGGAGGARSGTRAGGKQAGRQAGRAGRQATRQARAGRAHQVLEGRRALQLQLVRVAVEGDQLELGAEAAADSRGVRVAERLAAQQIQPPVRVVLVVRPAQRQVADAAAQLHLVGLLQQALRRGHARSRVRLLLLLLLSAADVLVDGPQGVRAISVRWLLLLLLLLLLLQRGRLLHFGRDRRLDG